MQKKVLKREPWKKLENILSSWWQDSVETPFEILLWWFLPFHKEGRETHKAVLQGWEINSHMDTTFWFYCLGFFFKLKEACQDIPRSLCSHLPPIYYWVYRSLKKYAQLGLRCECRRILIHFRNLAITILVSQLTIVLGRGTAERLHSLIIFNFFSTVHNISLRYI